MVKFPRHHSRGFTLIEVMLVVGIISILAAVAIPGYQRLAARSHRTEMLELISKFKVHFSTVYESQGSFASSDTVLLGGSSSAVNPDPTLAAIGQPGHWDTTLSGWTSMPYVFDGGVRMRYWYVLGSADKDSGKVNDVTFFACGSFPGLGAPALKCLDGLTGNYFYSETFHSLGGSDGPVELPSF